MTCHCLTDLPALPDDPACSLYWQLALSAYEQFRKPGSNNSDAPMRAAAAAGKWPRVDPEDPQPGRYAVRLEPRGPLVPIEFSYAVTCRLQGVYVNPLDWWLQAAKRPLSVPQFKEMEAWTNEF